VPFKYIPKEVDRVEYLEDVGEWEYVSNEEIQEVDHPFIDSHPMDHVVDDDYIDDVLVLDNPDVVIGDPFNDFNGLYINFDLD
jgi:hypothetical protein